jgi:hypothetical protein
VKNKLEKNVEATVVAKVLAHLQSRPLPGGTDVKHENVNQVAEIRAEI